MPIARIRSFDPEAVSFLAAKLAACGFQLQFAAPGESLEEADLEITITRMDSATALEQARLQAEEMNVDVRVMPGVLVASEPAPAPEIIAEPEQPLEPVAPFQESPSVPRQATAAWTTPYHADLPPHPEEFVDAEFSQPGQSDEIEPVTSRTQEAAEAVSTGLKRSGEAIGSFAHSSAMRFAEWRPWTSEARARRRAQGEQELAAAGLRPQPVTGEPLKSRTPYMRDRRFRKAAVAAAVVIVAGMIGWSFAGLGGPANPVRNSLSNVQQQTPFGAALVSAPAQAFAATPHAAIIAPAQPARSVAKPTSTRSTRTAHRRTRHRTSVSRSASADDGEEVVVRHFGNKPVAQQAKARTKDGVKVITEE